MVMLNRKNAEKINPATEEKQTEIVAALSGNLNDLITALNTEFDNLRAKFTDATQKTKIISDAGTVADLVSEFSALKAKFTDATQKTKLISDAGVVVDLVAEFTALKAKLTDATQKTQLVDAGGANLYPAGKAATIEVRLTRPADTVQYTAGDAINSSVATPVSVQLANFGLSNGKGAWITGINVATNLLNLASATIRIWLYRTTPTMVGDNVAITNIDANTALGRQYIDVTLGPLLAGSTVLIGQVTPMLLMQCDVAHSDIQQTIQTLATFTPVSAGFIDLTYTLLQL